MLSFLILLLFFFFFFNDTATTEIYTLSLHDALPISIAVGWLDGERAVQEHVAPAFSLEDVRRAPTGPPDCRNGPGDAAQDRKSTRLNSSHLVISYAVFCLKKKKKI